MDEKLQDRLLMSDHVMIGSDGSGSTHHPRGHGTFARVIEHYVVKKGTLRLPQAIYKMTGLPAKTLGLKSRGVLKVGSMADVLVFDPGAVRERATFSSPQRRSVGMHWVFIAGQAVVKKGRIMKRRAGRLLLKK
jgi:N-acyl-D-amino-acid deacylase